jgi:hypothetical protein
MLWHTFVVALAVLSTMLSTVGAGQYLEDEVN